MKDQAQWAALQLAVLGSIVLVAAVACGGSNASSNEKRGVGGVTGAIETGGNAGASLDVSGTTFGNKLGKAGANASEEQPIGLHGQPHDSEGTSGAGGSDEEGDS